MKMHTALACGIRDLGVGHLFGLAGDANLFFLHSIVQNGRVKYIAAPHEASAVAMASGFARASGGLGVATVTHGPGLTNTMTALVEAVKSSVPLLVICGDTPADARQHLQDIRQQMLVESVGAGFQQVHSAETAVEDLAFAAHLALVQSMPVVLNVPLHLQDADIQYSPPEPLSFQIRRTIDLDAVDRALGVIASARRPLILAGRGAIGAGESLVHLARRLGAPIATSLLAKGLFQGEVGNLGIFGSFSTPGALEVIAKSDCVIAFGCSFSGHTTVNGSLLGGKSVVQCDIDQYQLGKWVPITEGVAGDSETIAKAMLDWLIEADHGPSGFQVEAANILASYVVGERPDRSTDEAIDIRTFVRELDSMLPKARQLVFDGGRFIVETSRKLSIQHPGDLIWPLGFGAIGLGMGTAVGASLARREITTVALVGDGGFMIGGILDLNTAVQHRLGLIVILFNDGSYGAEFVQLVQRGLDPGVSMNAWPDLSSAAQAFGASTVVVQRLSDLTSLRSALDTRAHDETLFVEVRLNPDHVPDKYEPDR